jgi:RHS repeat-associated protein
MKAFTFSFRILFFVCFLTFGSMHAAVESTIASLSGALNTPIAVNRQLTIVDQWQPFPVGWNTLFRVNSATSNVVLRYDDHDRTYADKTWTLDITYTIITYNVAGTPTTTTGEVLSIDYDPREGIHYTDRDMRTYTNADKAKVTVTGVSYNEWTPAGGITQTATNLATIPSWLDDIYLDLELHVERFYNLSTASAPTLTLTENTTTNELDVNWGYVQGAESYDLEWLFIDAGTTTYPYTGSYDFDFRNATRVNVPNQHYSISLAYPKGIILVRCRPVGVDWDNYVNNTFITRGEGPWTYTSTTGTTTGYSSYRHNIQFGLLPGMNWAYSAGFAEDGKRMEGAEFYDGIMRGREGIAVVNSDNNVIVSSGAFDYEGRPAVSYLPYAQENAGIKYYPGGAVSSTSSLEYHASDFDADGTVGGPVTMANSSGVGEYYSSANTISGNEQVPDAGGYPFSRVTYLADGTNRPATSAAAGSDLTIGSGKETQYFYGTPSQVQLDRLFGNEVGYATHYKKNFTIDANGVVSVSYIDQHGRVIATALAGEAPANLVAIDNPNGNPMARVGLTDDLLAGNDFTPENDGTYSEFTLAVTETSVHDFTYILGVEEYCPETGCYTTCEDCKYDLLIQVFNRSQDSVDINGVSAGFAQRHYDLASGTYTFSLTLNPGTYRVTKILTLNEDNLDAIRQNFIDYQYGHLLEEGCVPPVDPDVLPCPADCHEACVQHYLVDGVYVDDNGDVLVNQAEGPDLIAACQLMLCDEPATPDPCEVKRLGLLDDMSPGGQYFDNLPSRFTIDPSSGLQTINAGYYSIMPPATYVSGDINGWLDGQSNSTTMRGVINTYASESFGNWDEVRDNWDPAWAELLLSYHPEYCAWNYHCNWNCVYTPEGTSTTYTITSVQSYNYEQETQYNTDGNFSGTDGFYWNPLDMPACTTHTYTAPSCVYLPYGDNNQYHMDPRFAGDCDVEICASPSATAEAALENYLTNFYPAYDNSNVFIGYYSLWYVALDPDDIAGNLYPGLSTETHDLFTELHGTGGLISSSPSADQITPYQFFRSVYFYYRALVLEQGFVGDADVMDCQADRDYPAYDGVGYLVDQSANPVLTPEGFTIYYMHNPLIDVYGNGCDTPVGESLAEILIELVDDAAENPDDIAIGAPNSATCSCQMLRDYVDSRGFVGIDTTNFAGIAATMNAEFGVSTYTDMIVSAWYDECHTLDAAMGDFVSFPEELTCDMDAEIEDANAAVQSTCQDENADIANYNSNFTYMNQLNAAADAYVLAYKENCLANLSETFSVDYELHEYYYTLYYYDQAGNLVKTVPPEGVNVITSIPTLSAVKSYRAGIAPTFTPAVHDMRSVYMYNSLQQPVLAQQNEQGTAGSDIWESGETSFWYDYLGRLVVSQNTKQAAMSPPAYSYTVYDDLGRISEVGQLQSSTSLAKDETGSRNSNDYYFYNSSPTTLEGWIAAAASTKREVTYTYYDETWSGINGAVTTAMGASGQENLRNRVATVVYDDDPFTATNLYTDGSTASASGFMNAFHYSYDVHGNVKAMVQETPLLETHNQDLKKTTYEYDLISGNVNGVYYQQGERDEFDHRYEYDRDNRLHMSYSSRDGKTWEKESKQLYYSIGGMKRLEIGDKTVQGQDYVYTINGWTKGMNRNTIGSYGEYMERDMGQDGETAASNNNKNFGADAAGFTLDYFAGDYTAVNSSVAFEATKTGTSYGSAILPQYNGNIAGMATSMLENDQSATEVQGRAFTYDQLYRIKQSLAFHMHGGAVLNNLWQSSYMQDNRYRENFTYDWNGNIKTVERHDGTTSSALMMDDLIYDYATNSNLLTYIDDGFANTCSATGGYDDDLDAQATANYSYDGMGALTDDVSERIIDIEWNPYGKMKAVRKDPANNSNTCMSTEYVDADVEYLYTASQQRLCKIVKPHEPAGAGLKDQEHWTYYWYAYDAGGQLMAVYKQTFENLHASSQYEVHLDVQEHDVYGSGRLGVRKGDDDGKYYMSFVLAGKELSGPDIGKFTGLAYYDASAALSRDHFTRELGNKQYEIANHLGNVLVTISDKRLGYMDTPSSPSTVDWYTADVLSYSDYYVFGAAQPGRTGGDSYRYGFNGKENDTEVEAAAIQDYGMRMYDPRVGRFFSADPLMFEYAYYTPYQFAGNMPISFIDLDGCEPACPSDGKGTTFGETCKGTDGTVYTWTQYPNTDPANNQGAWLASGESVLVSIPDPIAKTVELGAVTITASMPKLSRDEIEAAVLDYSGMLVDSPERNVDLSGITYSTRDYNSVPVKYYSGVFVTNVVGSLYNAVVVGNLDLVLNTESVICDTWNSTNRSAAHQAVCVHTGTVLEDCGDMLSNPHTYENAVATGIGIWAGARVFPGGAGRKGLVGNRVKYLKDFATKNTKNYSAYYNSEQAARSLARQKLGKNPIEVAPNKWRSANGKWQYRAKPGDVSKKHIHLEELNPKTGEVKANYHLRW